jgi:hypothetical protein
VRIGYQKERWSNREVESRHRTRGSRFCDVWCKSWARSDECRRDDLDKAERETGLL